VSERHIDAEVAKPGGDGTGRRGFGMDA